MCKLYKKSSSALEMYLWAKHKALVYFVLGGLFVFIDLQLTLQTKCKKAAFICCGEES